MFFRMNLGYLKIWPKPSFSPSRHVNEDSFAHLPQSPGGIQPPTTTHQAQQLSKDILCHEGTSIQSGLSFKCSLLGFSSYLKYYGLKGEVWAIGNIPYVPSPSECVLSDFKAKIWGSISPTSGSWGHHAPLPMHLGLLWPHCEKFISCSKRKSSTAFSGC